jgi:hypothetical protein
MDIVKKNIVSIILGVVALLCVVAVFIYPTPKYYESLRTDANARKAEYDKVKALVDQKRQLPILDPESTEPKELNTFPTRPVIDEGARLTKAVAQSSQGLMEEVVKINQHKLLLVGSLPAPNPVTGINFISAYQRRVNPPLPPEDRSGSIQNEILRAGMPPSDTDITRAKEETKVRISRERLVWDKGVAINQEQVNQEINSQLANLPDVMRSQAAKSCLIYMQPDAINVNPTIVGNQPPDPVNIWNAQVQLWVQEDVCLALRALNSQPISHTNGTSGPASSPPVDVTESPVKHLYKLDVAPMFGAGAVMPVAPVGADPNAPNYAVSPTGRMSNALYDVVPFHLVVNVEVDKVPALLAELTRNRLITVRQVESINPIDSAGEAAKGYIYGRKPIVQVALSGEELLLRQWTVPWMPEAVRKALNVTVPTPGSTETPATPAA